MNLVLCCCMQIVEVSPSRLFSRMQELETVIRPAVSGVENVLKAVNKTPSVQRVVLTSSVAAVVGDHWERGRDHVYTETDWNQTATQTFLPYHRHALVMQHTAVSPKRGLNTGA
jgi:nucleoside-diphosphate-sugar epimerase